MITVSSFVTCKVIGDSSGHRRGLASSLAGNWIRSILIAFGEVHQHHEEGDQLKRHVDHRRHVRLGDLRF